MYMYLGKVESINMNRREYVNLNFKLKSSSHPSPSSLLSFIHHYQNLLQLRSLSEGSRRGRASPLLLWKKMLRCMSRIRLVGKTWHVFHTLEFN
jgi:hypothetical protein